MASLERKAPKQRYSSTRSFLPSIFICIVIGGYIIFMCLTSYMETKYNIKTPSLSLLWPVTIVEKIRMNWDGDCSYPSYIPVSVQSRPWFQLYLDHLQRVSLSAVSLKRQALACARWWYPTHQHIRGEYPSRKTRWKFHKPPLNFKRPNCSFGQDKVKATRCTAAQAQLWRVLDDMGVLYFPRSGTELGIVRESKYLTSDGDVDVFVDMPQEKLLQALKKVLKPKPRLSGHITSDLAEVHWKVKGCSAVHMVFGDWMSDEMVNIFGRPTHESTCTCYMNSSPLSCHIQGLRRMFVQYGPSWRVPLHAKALDVPTYARKYNIASKLQIMASEDDIIYEDAVRGQDPTIDYADEEMQLILAQLNVLKSLIAYQKRCRAYKVV